LKQDENRDFQNYDFTPPHLSEYQRITTIFGFLHKLIQKYLLLPLEILHINETST